jgi:hypothetical protein
MCRRSQYPEEFRQRAEQLVLEAANKGKRTTPWPASAYPLGRGQAMLSDVNRKPRRWVDESGRVRVIEGWHPSEPCQVGFNLMVDGDWFGTFETLDGAATAAAAYADIKDGKVVLRPYPDPLGRGGKSTGAGLHLVQPVPDED